VSSIATEAVDGTRPIALVTGASEGFGRELTRLLAADGFDLITVARNEVRLAELAAELTAAFGTRVAVERADLAQLEEQLRVAELVRSRANLKVLVNNAAFSVVAAIHQLSAATIQRMVTLNLAAVCTLSAAALGNTDFRRGGTLLNVGSIGGSWPLPLDATYCGTKAAIDNFTQAIAFEVAQDPEIDVHVQVAKLGGLATGWSDRALGRLAPGERPSAIVEWFQNDPAAAARVVWTHAKRRRKSLVADTAFVRMQAAVLGTFQRLGSRFVYASNSREISRRRRP
jgi:short-subunit dehydrogenase